MWGFTVFKNINTQELWQAGLQIYALEYPLFPQLWRQNNTVFPR